MGGSWILTFDINDCLCSQSDLFLNSHNLTGLSLNIVTRFNSTADLGQHALGAHVIVHVYHGITIKGSVLCKVCALSHP